MKYETAQKLRDAGFSQDFEFGDSGYCSKKYGCTYVNGWLNFKYKEMVGYDDTGEYGCGDEDDGFIRVPTLERLIDACGDGLYDLYKVRNVGMAGLNSADFHWQCNSKDETAYIGDTPTEAVANLWLALNK